MTPTSSSHPPHAQLGPREREIMDIVYRRGQVTAEEVRSELADAVTNSAVRGMLRLLEEKGHVRHEQQGVRYVYLPARDPEQVRRSALRALVHTFFDNSAGSAAAAMLGLYEERLTDEDLNQLESLIERARKRGGAK
jgi:predicted transcriptional regulator